MITYSVVPTVALAKAILKQADIKETHRAALILTGLPIDVAIDLTAKKGIVTQIIQA